ncbi:MAG: class I SAM-dependent methyltransferase [Ruminococcus sp.]|nr:class I SAM-dependent methyltransferase [Ruminococcus sp.]
MMLSKRLTACAALVTKGGTVCDVGTDHAYLPAYLLRQEICTYAILTDIHAGPLEAARRTLQENRVLEQTELYQCDGLESVASDMVTDVVIAGMGGEMIVHILEHCDWVWEKHLILQPMMKANVLRRWLAAQGYLWTERIVIEKMYEEQRFYTVLDVHFTGEKWTPTQLELEVGVLDWKKKESLIYGKWRQQKFIQLAERLERVGKATAVQWWTMAEEIEKCRGKNHVDC